MARRFIDGADCGRDRTGLGEFILALLLLARRCNVSVKNGDISFNLHSFKGGNASQAHRSEEHWTSNAGVSLEEVTNRDYKQPNNRREYW